MEVVGVDVSSNMVSIALERANEIRDIRVITCAVIKDDKR